jgi:hypothetical protein
MAVKPVTKTAVIPASGKVSLATVLGRAEDTWIGSLAMRAARTNKDDVYWSDEGNEWGGFIGPAEAATMDYGEGQALLVNFYLWGEPGDKVLLTAGINRHYFQGVV